MVTVHAWETTVFYLSHHPRWFESPLRRVPDDRHLTVHRELVPDDWKVWRRGYWLICEPPGHDPALGVGRLCDRLLDELLTGPRTDDAAVIAVRIADDWGRTAD